MEEKLLTKGLINLNPISSSEDINIADTEVVFTGSRGEPRFYIPCEQYFNCDWSISLLLIPNRSAKICNNSAKFCNKRI